MKTYLKKLLFIATVAALSVSPAANANFSEIETDTSLARCIQQGNLDFIFFINSTIAGDGFEGSFIDPWEDVFARNECQSMDVLSLLQQRTKVRSVIRDSLFSCNDANIPNLKKAYSKLNMDIYYVRHVVDGGLVLSTPFSVLETRMLQDPDSMYADSATLKAEIKDRYFDENIMTEQEFDLHFQLLEQKYETRKETYVLCESSSWEVVEDKWDQFIESAGGVGPAAENFEEGVERQADRIEQFAESADRTSLDEYLGGLVKTTVNSVDPSLGIQQITDDLNDQFGDFGAYSSPTVNDVISTLSTEEFRYDTDVLEAQMRAKYTGLYREGGDGSVSLFVNELVQFNQILKEALGPIKVVENCSDTVKSRQCK